MSKKTSSTEVIIETLADDLKIIVANAEDLLNATASQAGGKVEEVRARIQDSLGVATAKLDRLGELGINGAKQAAHATDDLIHEHSWKAIGVGTALGIILGMLIARR